MKLIVRHLLLTLAPDFDHASSLVRRFFQRTQLVHYDALEVLREESVSNAQPEFWERLEQGIRANQEVVAALLAELAEAGVRRLDDLTLLPKGYQSKLIHTLAHLLDGFIGIDTVFYNLVDDDHAVSEELRREIRATPGDYWLIEVQATLGGQPHDTVFSGLRRFER